MKLTLELLEQYFNIHSAIETRANELVNTWQDVRKEVFPEYNKIGFSFTEIDRETIEFNYSRYDETMHLSTKHLLDPNFESNLRKQFEDEKIKTEERLKRESNERRRYILLSNKRAKILKLLEETLPDTYKKLEKEAEK